ncbi:F-box incomplete domain containing protein [Pandoravirus dulcis]|uniref:F-box incomplete domain containing protein n=1 Tax=Pandoravirus dulcis TaxID=1349409 RepID=S4VZG4_9VIRU|nr:F-box incomplete domain containing protein [Pandoravirus dulcis]AGO83244.1 F-box incomplete domain containing protein [Pandoravirus dulcis]
MQTVDCFDALPLEILTLILADKLPARWRFCARPVCRLWRDVLDAAGDETKNPPRNEYHDLMVRRYARDVPWKLLDKAAVAHGRYHTVACRWRRGVIVLASTVAEWARTRPDLWDHRAGALVAWCMACQHASPADIAKALVASGRKSMARHVLGPLFLADDGRPFLDSLTASTQRAIEFIDAATLGGLATTARVVDALGPIRWHALGDLGWFTGGDCPEACEMLLRQWARATAHDVDDDGNNYSDSLLTLLWESLAFCGNTRILARLLELVSSHAAGRCRRAKSRSLEARLAATWSEDAGSCFLRAWLVRKERPHILEAGRASLTGDLARRVVRKTWRRGHIANVKWCKDNLGLPPITLDALLEAANQRRDFFEWVFDPRGAGHAPADDAEITALFRALAATNPECALWFAEKWPHACVAAGPSALTSLVRAVCDRCKVVTYRRGHKGRDTPGGMLERLVRSLDARAARARPDDVDLLVQSCDLWSTLLSVGREPPIGLRDDWAVALCYVRARVAGDDDDETVDMLGGCGPLPAPQALWRRWCRVRPVSLAEIGLADADVAAAVPDLPGVSPMLTAYRTHSTSCVLDGETVVQQSRAAAVALAECLRANDLLAAH